MARIPVLPLGDSLTFGKTFVNFLPTSIGGYRVFMDADRLKIRQVGSLLDALYHEGHSGATASQILTGIGVGGSYAGAVASYIYSGAKHVTLMIGTNDARSGIPNQVATSVQSICSGIHAVDSTAKIFLAQVINCRTDDPSRNAGIAAINAAVSALMAGVPNVIWVPMPFLDDSMFGDTLHLTTYGYSVMYFGDGGANGWQKSLIAAGL